MNYECLEIVRGRGARLRGRDARRLDVSACQEYIRQWDSEVVHSVDHTGTDF